jgi:hypothetical protein
VVTYAPDALGDPVYVVIAAAGTNKLQREWFVPVVSDYTVKDGQERAQ